jgi:hypothetical protein
MLEKGTPPTESDEDEDEAPPASPTPKYYEITAEEEAEIASFSKEVADSYHKHTVERLDLMGAIHAVPVTAPETPVPRSVVPIGETFERLNIWGRYMLMHDLVDHEQRIKEEEIVRLELEIKDVNRQNQELTEKISMLELTEQIKAQTQERLRTMLQEQKELKGNCRGLRTKTLATTSNTEPRNFGCQQ